MLSKVPSACNLFADDLLLFKVFSHVRDFIAVISAVEDWSTDNYLTLNPK